MQRSEERILTTHVGSLIRPKELLELTRTPVEGGQVSRASRGLEYSQEPDDPAYRETLRRAVADVVQHQAAAGVDVVSDGEFGKSSWAAYILERITGFERQSERLSPLTWLGSDRERFREFWEAEMPAALTGVPADIVVGPITYKGESALQRDIDNFKAALAGVSVTDGFLPVAAPASVGYNSFVDFYKSDEEFVFAVAEALRHEYLAIIDAGLLLQIDDAVLTHMHEEPNYRTWAETRIEATNHALRGIPSEKVRYHICFGSWHVPHVSDAPLKKILDLVLKVNAGAYSIEAANPRHEWEWTVWEETRLPEGKILIPGVITHHTNVVEHPELIAQRIVRFADLVGRENVIAGSDCGFAQAAGVQRVHPTIMWAKLESLADGARLATKRLWG
jgi:5-methyltetrahydropteroyltriglutamate--homocysteine methyltransferase